MLETLDYTIRIGSIPTFLYFDIYIYIYIYVYMYIYIYIVLNPKVAQLIYMNVSLSLPGCYATDTGSGVLWLCHSGEIWKRTSHQHTPQSLSTCHWWNCCWHWLEYKDWFCRKDGCNYCRANISSIFKVMDTQYTV